MALKGRSNGYQVKFDHDGMGWVHNRFNKRCEYPDCTEMVRSTSTYCRSHAFEMRETAHLDELLDVDPQYLAPTPDGMELIWYPRMAMSARGKKQVRRIVKRRLKRYFARKQETVATGRQIDPLVAEAWRKDFS